MTKYVNNEKHTHEGLLNIPKIHIYIKFVKNQAIVLKVTMFIHRENECWLYVPPHKFIHKRYCFLRDNISYVFLPFPGIKLQGIFSRLEFLFSYIYLHFYSNLYKYHPFELISKSFFIFQKRKAEKIIYVYICFMDDFLMTNPQIIRARVHLVNFFFPSIKNIPKIL